MISKFVVKDDGVLGVSWRGGCLAGDPRMGPRRGGEEAKWVGRWGIWRRALESLSTWERLLGPLPRQCSHWTKDGPGQGL